MKLIHWPSFLGGNRLLRQEHIETKKLALAAARQVIKAADSELAKIGEQHDDPTVAPSEEVLRQAEHLSGRREAAAEIAGVIIGKNSPDLRQQAS